MREIINTHDQLVAARAAGMPCVAVCAATAPLGRHQSGWHVYVPGKQTDPKAHWTDNGQKWFSIIGEPGSNRSERKQAALLKAQTWASENYGPVEKWVRNPMRDYVDARVNKQFPLRKRV